jgi:hypothetical protein
MADTETAEATTPAKQKLSPEERKLRVQEARAAKVRAAFEGKRFEFVQEINLEGDARYTDVTGNKGKNGFAIRNVDTDEVINVGPSSLKKAEEMGVITLPEGVFSKRRAADEADESDEDSVDE